MKWPPRSAPPGAVATPCIWLVALAGVCVTSAATAGTFGPNGAYKPDPMAVATDDFEAYPPDPGGAGGAAGGDAAGGSGTGGDAGGAGGEAAGSGGDAGEAGSGGAKLDYTLVDDATALTGARVMEILPYRSVGIGVELPAGNASYVARVWVKNEASVTAQVEYDDGTPFTLSQLMPTGRVTSDGWVELESPPFSVEAARGPAVSVGFFSPSGVTVDALEVVSSGEYRDGHACTGVADEGACRPDEVCIAHHCVDARGFVPPLPSPDDRSALVDYTENRLRFLFGPYENRKTHLPDAIATLESMRTATDRYGFWYALIEAVQRLSDSHSSAYGLYQFVYGQNKVKGRTPLNACFIGGDADTTHDLAPSEGGLPDVLVSHGGTVASWGLSAGDRLVSVDGVHPLLWQRALVGRVWSTEQVDDPDSPAQQLEALRNSIAQQATTIRVIRCHGSLVCDPPEDIEVGAQADPDSPIDWVACDNRPLIHLDGVPPDHGVGDEAFAGVVLESGVDERIHGLVWDSLSGSGSALNQQISGAVSSWKSDGARGVILDHRTGNGGTNDTAIPVLAFLSPPRYVHASVWRAFAGDEGPKSLAEGLALFDAYKDEKSNFGKIGSAGASLDVPVALLVTRDVSASDYFPHSLKGSPNARIFGPHPTNGAFSSFIGYSYWLSVSFQLAAGDTLDIDGSTLTGHGVVPDELVTPRQSDLATGKDTVYEAALAWVRANLKAEGGAQ
jgi:hypothetical protein